MTVPDDFNGGFTNPPPPPPQGYGQQPYPGQQYGGPPGYSNGPQNGLGIAALVLGIIGMLLGLLVIGGLFGAIAVGLGLAGRSRAKKGLADNKGVATAGVITGLLGVLLAAAVVGLLVVGGWAFWHSKTVEDIRHCVSSNQTAAQQATCEQKFGITPSPSS